MKEIKEMKRRETLKGDGTLKRKRRDDDDHGDQEKREEHAPPTKKLKTEVLDTPWPLPLPLSRPFVFNF